MHGCVGTARTEAERVADAGMKTADKDILRVYRSEVHSLMRHVAKLAKRVKALERRKDDHENDEAGT